MPGVRHRSIYERHHGPIPKDAFGRTYDIHHIDGDKCNNDLSNLKAVTILEHYDIHLVQKDYWACVKIAKRMSMSPDKISHLARLSSKRQIAEGKHPFVGSSFNKKLMAEGRHHFVTNNPSKRRSADGTHHFLDSANQSKWVRQRVADGTHHLLGGAIQRRLVAEGKHHLLGGEIQRAAHRRMLADGTHYTFKVRRCPRCGKEGRGSNMSRYHFDNCKTRASCHQQ